MQKKTTVGASEASAPKKVTKKKVAAKTAKKTVVAKKKLPVKTAPIAAHVSPVKEKIEFPAAKVSQSTAGDTFIVKKAFSTNPNQILFKIRTFVGWSAMVTLVFAGLSILSDYSTTGGDSKFNNKNVQASVLTGDSGLKANPSIEKNAPVVTPAPVNSVAVVPQKDDVTLMAVGDVMLARFVEKKIRTSKDYTYPFVNVKDILSTADITFANLETLFFPGSTTPTGSYTFRADKESIAGLTAAGFDVLSLANNHTMNYRVPGLQTTLEALMGAGIKGVGAGQNIAEANTPVYVTVKGRKIAFLAYNDATIAPRRHGEATEDTAGIAKLDVEQMKKSVAEAKANGADFIVVSMHAGIEYRKAPSLVQKEFAHAAIDAGASVVIGHHPHIVQEVERYGKGIIMYSLGNFVFDQLFSEDVKTGLFARITLKGDGTVGAEFSPVSNEKTLQPRILEGQIRVDLLGKLGVPEKL